MLKKGELKIPAFNVNNSVTKVTSCTCTCGVFCVIVKQDDIINTLLD